MSSIVKTNILSLTTIGIMVIASVAYLFIGVSMISGSSRNGATRIADRPTATPTPEPTPCTPDDPQDPKKPCPTPTVSPMPTPSPTMLR